MTASQSDFLNVAGILEEKLTAARVMQGAPGAKVTLTIDEQTARMFATTFRLCDQLMTTSASQEADLRAVIAQQAKLIELQKAELIAFAKMPLRIFAMLKFSRWAKGRKACSID